MTTASAMPPGFVSWQEAGREVVTRREVADAVRGALAEADSLWAWARDRATASATTGRGVVYRARLGEVDVAVRRARRGGWAGPLLGDRYFGGPPRPFVEIETSEALREAGVATPRALAATVRRSWPGYRSEIATEWLEPGHDLEEMLAPERYPADARAKALRAAGALVGRAHDAGLDHPDLNVGNLFVQPTAEGGWTASLLDLDRARVEPGANAPANLDRFRRSLEKRRREGRIAWDEDEWRAFAAAYDEARSRA